MPPYRACTDMEIRENQERREREGRREGEADGGHQKIAKASRAPSPPRESLERDREIGEREKREGKIAKRLPGDY